MAVALPLIKSSARRKGESQLTASLSVRCRVSCGKLSMQCLFQREQSLPNGLVSVPTFLSVLVPFLVTMVTYLDQSNSREEAFQLMVQGCDPLWWRSRSPRGLKQLETLHPGRGDECLCDSTCFYTVQDPSPADSAAHSVCGSFCLELIPTIMRLSS